MSLFNDDLKRIATSLEKLTELLKNDPLERIATSLEALSAVAQSDLIVQLVRSIHSIAVRSEAQAEAATVQTLLHLVEGDPCIWSGLDEETVKTLRALITSFGQNYAAKWKPFLSKPAGMVIKAGEASQ